MAAQSIPYAWTTDDDVVDLNAVTVSIGSAEQDEGEWVDVGATVLWVERHGTPGGAEDFDDIPAALERAEEARNQFGFPRVVISLDDRSIWKDDWGVLAAEAGY